MDNTILGNGARPSSGGICCGSDSYKVSHWKQYPPGAQTVYSYTSHA